VGEAAREVVIQVVASETAALIEACDGEPGAGVLALRAVKSAVSVVD
jgi:hypothetical protein